MCAQFAIRARGGTALNTAQHKHTAHSLEFILNEYFYVEFFIHCSRCISGRPAAAAAPHKIWRAYWINVLRARAQ